MLRTLAFILMMCGGVLAATWSRFGALLFYLWFALFRPQEWVWIDVEQFRLSMVVGMLLVVPSLFSGVFPNVTHKISLGMILFLAAACGAQLNAINPDLGWFHLSALSRLIIVSLLLITLTDTPARLRLVLVVMGVSLGYHGAKFGTGFVLGGGAQFTSGIGGSFSGNNEFGLALSRIVFLILCMAQNLKRFWVKAGFAIVVPLTVLAIISTYSRGAFLAVASGFAVYMLLQRRKMLTIAAMAVAAFVMLWLAPIQTSYVDRLHTITTYEDVQEESALSRLHFWKVALVMAEDNPLGVGLRNFELAYDRYDFSHGAYKTKRSVHSSHFQALAETGYIGFLIWLFLLTYSLWITWRSRRIAKHLVTDPDTQKLLLTTANALLASQVAFIVGGTFQAELLNDLNWFIFGLVAALDRITRSVAAQAGTPGGAVVPEPVAAGAPGTVNSRVPLRVQVMRAIPSWS